MPSESKINMSSDSSSKGKAPTTPQGGEETPATPRTPSAPQGGKALAAP